MLCNETHGIYRQDTLLHGYPLSQGSKKTEKSMLSGIVLQSVPLQMTRTLQVIALIVCFVAVLTLRERFYRSCADGLAPFRATRQDFQGAGTSSVHGRNCQNSQHEHRECSCSPSPCRFPTTTIWYRSR